MWKWDGNDALGIISTNLSMGIMNGSGKLESALLYRNEEPLTTKLTSKLDCKTGMGTELLKDLSANYRMLFLGYPTKD